MKNVYIRLKEISEEVASLSSIDILETNDRELLKIFRELDFIVAQDIEDRSIEWMYKQDGFNEIVYNISRFRRLYGLKLEIEQAKELINNRDPWERLKKFVFYKNYRELSNMEKKAGNLRENDTVIFIGSGPLPMSLIMLGAIHNINSIGVEQQEGYVDISTQLINKLGLDKKIQIIHGDHRDILDFKYKGFLVMVASAAYPKQEIFDFLGLNVKPQTKIIYRTYEKGLRKVFCDFEFKIPPNLLEIKRVHPSPPVNNSVVVLKKI